MLICSRGRSRVKDDVLSVALVPCPVDGTGTDLDLHPGPAWHHPAKPHRGHDRRQNSTSTSTSTAQRRVIVQAQGPDHQALSRSVLGGIPIDATQTPKVVHARAPAAPDAVSMSVSVSVSMSSQIIDDHLVITLVLVEMIFRVGVARNLSVVLSIEILGGVVQSIVVVVVQGRSLAVGRRPVVHLMAVLVIIQVGFMAVVVMVVVVVRMVMVIAVRMVATVMIIMVGMGMAVVVITAPRSVGLGGRKKTYTVIAR